MNHFNRFNKVSYADLDVELQGRINNSGHISNAITPETKIDHTGTKRLVTHSSATIAVDSTPKYHESTVF